MSEHIVCIIAAIGRSMNDFTPTEEIEAVVAELQRVEGVLQRLLRRHAWLESHGRQCSLRPRLPAALIGHGGPSDDWHLQASYDDGDAA